VLPNVLPDLSTCDFWIRLRLSFSRGSSLSVLSLVRWRGERSRSFRSGPGGCNRTSRRSRRFVRFCVPGAAVNAVCHADVEGAGVAGHDVDEVLVVFHVHSSCSIERTPCREWGAAGVGGVLRFAQDDRIWEYLAALAARFCALRFEMGIKRQRRRIFLRACRLLSRARIPRLGLEQIPGGVLAGLCVLPDALCASAWCLAPG